VEFFPAISAFSAFDRLWGMFFYFVKNVCPQITQKGQDGGGMPARRPALQGLTMKYAAVTDRRYTERRSFLRLFPPFAPLGEVFL
jgi:hypothetical protein